MSNSCLHCNRLAQHCALYVLHNVIKCGKRELALIDLILTNRDDFVEEVAVTLGESVRVLLQFLISKETKAECSYRHMLDF